MWGQHYPDTKGKWGPYKQRKLQANTPDEYRCKNSWQNISKPNSTAHLKDYTPWSKWDSSLGSKVDSTYENQ